MVLCEGEILPEHLPLPDVHRTRPETPRGTAALDPTPATLASMERRHILFVLDKAKGNRTQAADMLGIGLRTLRPRIHELGLDQALPPRPGRPRRGAAERADDDVGGEVD